MPSNNEFMVRRGPFFHAGFSLIEIMVGLVIGLLATLVITQVFAIFEGQKRSTTGTADAQTNGSIALFNVQRDVQMAGYGLPVFDTINPPLKCDPSPTILVDHDSNGATAAIPVDIFPISIVDGGTAAGASDKIYVRYGATQMGGIGVKVISLPAGTDLGVDNNLGCRFNDVALVSNGITCALKRVTESNAALDTAPFTLITLNNVTGLSAATGTKVACLGGWNEYQYEIKAGESQLSRNNVAIVPDIVNIQAQYGISLTADSNVVTSWVDATGAYLYDPAVPTPSVANRNRIKAIRIAIVSRNGLLEKDDVTPAALTWAGTPDTNGKLDLSNNGDWKKYRYRVFETTIPLRNMIWSGNTL